MTERRTRDLLEGLRDEEPGEERRTLDVRSNETLEALMRGFEELIRRYEDSDLPEDIFETYGVVSETITKLEVSYTLDDINEFFISLIKQEGKDNFDILAGFYLSFLSNTCTEEGDLTFYNELLSCNPAESLGFKNRRNLTIIGTAYHPGGNMSAGKIQVTGYVGGEVGAFMTGGIIHGQAYADSGANLGYGMEGGTIIVEGTAKDTVVAKKMRGGEITLKGGWSSTNSTKHLCNEMMGGKVTIYGPVEGKIGGFAPVAILDLHQDDLQLGDLLPSGLTTVRGTICHKGVPVFRNGAYLQ